MTHSYHTDEVRDTFQKDSRGGTPIDMIILHHMASPNGRNVVEDLMIGGGRQVSANYAILNDGWAISVVPEEDRAWTSGSPEMDSRAITFEVANTTGDPSYGISNVSREKVAEICADLVRRYGIFTDRDHFVGHNELLPKFDESYATACPLNLDVDLVLDMTLAILAVPPGKRLGPIGKAKRALRRRGFYPVVSEDEGGSPDFYKAIQTALTSFGYYSGPIDGALGTVSYKAMQELGRDRGGYGGPIDGVLGARSWAGFTFGIERGSGPLEHAYDWAFHLPSVSVRSNIQASLAARGRYSGPIDGAWGSNTIKGIQTTIANVGYAGPVDGVPGERTCRFVQEYAARFGGYTGPRDSVLGANSWAGFAAGLADGAGTTPGGDGWDFALPGLTLRTQIQSRLAVKGRYSGPIDGDWGSNTIKGIQTTIANVGYTGPIDGNPGERTCHYVQIYAFRFGGYTGPTDSLLGPASWSGFSGGLLD